MLLTSHLFPYHLELPLIPPSAEVFTRHLTGDVLFGLQAKTSDDLSYVDTFYDTPVFDLHASGQVLRDRIVHRGKKVERYLEYKVIAGYVHQIFLARNFGSVRLWSDNDLKSYLALTTPCEPLQFLARDRPDLTGHRLRSALEMKVEKRIRFLFDGDTKLGVNLTFHQYLFSGQPANSGGMLIELKPTLESGERLYSYLSQIAGVVGAFLSSGYVIDPLMKYQRASRAILSR